MSIFSKFKENFPNTPKNKRIVLIAGGGGLLGEALIRARPENVFIINITKKSKMKYRDEMVINFDISKEAERAILYLSTIIDSLDVLINAAFKSNYAHIEDLRKDQFLEEFLLNSYIPVQLAQLCTKYFWSRETKEKNIENARKIINISSGASYGKTKRPDLASYGGSKAALNIMTEYLHDYTQKFGISSHVIAPGSLKDSDIMSKTINSIWELQSRMTLDFSAEKIY